MFLVLIEYLKIKDHIVRSISLFQKLSLKQECQTVNKEKCHVEKIENVKSNEIPVTKQNEHVFAHFGIMDSRALQT